MASRVIQVRQDERVLTEHLKWVADGLETPAAVADCFRALADEFQARAEQGHVLQEPVADGRVVVLPPGTWLALCEACGWEFPAEDGTETCPDCGARLDEEDE